MDNYIYRLAQITIKSLLSSSLQSEVYGLDNIPKKGGFILAANHISYIDPPALGCFLKRKPYYFARDSLFKKQFFSWLLSKLKSIPVKRNSRSEIIAIKKSIKILKDNQGLVFFPEGKRSLKGQLQKAKLGIGLIACKTQVPVIPAKIFGSNNVLKKNKFFFDLTHTVDIVYGSPIYPIIYDNNKLSKMRYQNATNIIMKSIQNLSLLLPPVI